MNRRTTGFAALVPAALISAAVTAPALADNWDMYLTVDNQFAAYFGTPFQTNFLAGTGNSWSTTYHYTALNRLPTDYLYVATASDQLVAQGFIGVFTNTTTNMTIEAGTLIWEVFAAGNNPATNPFYPNPWPPGLMPTQAQVDTAINYATTNNLWVAPDTFAGYTNGVSPWGTRPNIPATASWIWHRAPNGPANPLIGGFNHDEFLVFRVAGAVPTPGAAFALAGVLALRGRRRR